MSLETPIKLGPTLTLSPFFRYHTQTAADYFVAFAEHTINETFYTSDYDLSELQSHNLCLGISCAPLYSIGRIKAPFGKSALLLEKLQMRGTYYSRSTGLTGFLISIDLGFKIKKAN